MLENWITFPGASGGMRCAFYARKNWHLDQIPEHSELRISADSCYVLKLNGKLLGRGPVRGSTSLLYFDKYNIHEFLQIGDNELFVEIYSQGEQNFVLHSLYPALTLEIPEMLQSDSSWQVQNAACYNMDAVHYTMQSGYMEYCDLRKNADPEQWVNAVEIDYPALSGKTLMENTLPPFTENAVMPVNLLKFYGVNHDLPTEASAIPDALAFETHYPAPDINMDNLFVPGSDCFIPAGTNGIGMILEFENEVSGRLLLQMTAPAGCRVEVAYGEALTNDRIATHFDDMDYHFCDAFILHEGFNTLTTNFAERGFRMVQISVRNFEQPIIIHALRGINYRYPMVNKGSFFSSDYKLNRIYEVCRNTLECCCSDVFMDCPWRERAFWVNDLLVNNLATLHCFGATELHKHALELAFSQPHESNLISAVVPMPVMPEQCDFIFPATNLYMPLILKDYWHFSGDRTTVLRHLQDCEQILEAIWQLSDANGLLQSSGVTAQWNFYDWSFEENHYCCNGTAESMINSLFIIASKAFIELSEVLGYKFDRSKFQQRWQLTASNVENRFCDPQSGLLLDEVLDLQNNNQPIKISTQLAHALWLLTGETSEKMQAVCASALTDKNLLMPDYYLHYFYLQAAEKSGNRSECLERIRKYWGRCIDTGSPTLYEAGIHTFGKQSMNGSGSLCHGFGTIPTAFVHERILGIEAQEGGFRKFSFKPDLLDLEFAQGRIPVPGGCIEVELTRHGCSLSVPANCVAVLKNQELAAGKYRLTWEQVQ